MTNSFFEVLRPGINSTFQDMGRKNYYHIGLPFSGAMDQRNFLISKKKALFASKENIKEVEKIKQELSKKDLDKKKDSKSIQEKIQNKELKL